MRIAIHITKFLVMILCVMAVSGFPVSSQELTDDQVLELYKGLRVADVCDGMDMVGLRDAGTMDASIEPLWRDVETFGHRFSGIAVTARYVPTNKVVKIQWKIRIPEVEGDW
jgi:hypothetical protein